MRIFPKGLFLSLLVTLVLSLVGQGASHYAANRISGFESNADFWRYYAAGQVRIFGPFLFLLAAGVAIEWYAERRAKAGKPESPSALDNRSAHKKAVDLIAQIDELSDLHEGGYHHDLDVARHRLQRYCDKAKDYPEPVGLLSSIESEKGTRPCSP